MLLSDKALDAIAIFSLIVVIATCIRFERLEPEKGSKFKIIVELPHYTGNSFHGLRRMMIGLIFVFVGVVSLSGRSLGLINAHTDDHFKTVYSNSINAEVSYYNNGIVFTGGQDLNSTNSALDFAYLAGISKFDRKLILKKNQTTVTREVDNVEFEGDKSGKVVRIDYGKRSEYTEIFGVKFERAKGQSIVKIYLKESESVSKDRADLNKLLEIKE